MGRNLARRFAAVCCIAIVAGALPLLAAPPVVKVVPWVPSNPTIPHDTWSGKTITLKGTANMQGAGINYVWDFGDGGSTGGQVTNMYAIEATHAYTGSVGTVFTATLTVTNTADGTSASKNYYVAIRAQSLAVEVNRAIDEGLWYLHKTMYRYTCSGGTCPSGILAGYWNGANVGNSRVSNAAANVNAFEVNGHLESGNPDNPYVETVARGLHWVLANLSVTSGIGPQTNSAGTFNPDANGNGLGVWVNSGSYQFYETGPVMDAIIASGTPAALALTGPANVIGRQYKDIVQDMVDYQSYCQYDGSPVGGGWIYGCNSGGDNSISQWVAIGNIPAVREWGLTLHSFVKTHNKMWLNYSQNAAGEFGYQSSSPLWGPYATTPSGMVQMVMDGYGRGTSDGKWEKAETVMRNGFNASGGNYASNPRKYYYGLFSFTKSMLLHDSDNNGIPEPITMLHSQSAGVPDIDWYAAQVSQGDPVDGVARTLVNDQNPAGYWWGHSADGNQQYYETAWAIIMLNRTVVSSGVPVAVFSATPNPAVAFQVITFDGSASFHQDPAKSIVKWEWDFNNDGIFDALGPVVTKSFDAVGNYVVRLRVTDNAATPANASTTVTIVVSVPPLAPTANAGGPYNFCIGQTPWFLDGTKSTNPDDGQHQPGPYPGDYIKEYAWELNGNGSFNDAFGPQPNVTMILPATPSSFNISLRVTDNTAASFPASGQPDLTSTANTQVTIRASSDPACACSVASARARNAQVQLTWTPKAGAASYNVYRGTVSGGPYVKIRTVFTTAILDTGLTNGTTYYYVVRPAAPNTNEMCQSNQASAMPRPL
ncbi:MAG: PKD domain-containing protein [Bryobacteraceae bacterium]